MKRTSQLLTALSVCAFSFVVATPDGVQAHGGIGGFHAGAVHVGGAHVGGFSAAGFHAGGVHVGGVAGGRVGVYPHFNAGVGYYHPVARAAAWGAAYDNYNGYGGGGYGGNNRNPYAQGGPSGAGADANTTFGESAAAQQAKKQLDAALKADKDKDK